MWDNNVVWLSYKNSRNARIWWEYGPWETMTWDGKLLCADLNIRSWREDKLVLQLPVLWCCKSSFVPLALCVLFYSPIHIWNFSLIHTIFQLFLFLHLTCYNWWSLEHADSGMKRLSSWVVVMSLQKAWGLIN